MDYFPSTDEDEEDEKKKSHPIRYLVIFESKKVHLTKRRIKVDDGLLSYTIQHGFVHKVGNKVFILYVSLLTL